MTVYHSWTEVMADAATGSVIWSSFDTNAELYGYLHSNTPTVAQVKQLLAVVSVTEPQQDWVRNHWLTIDASGNVSITPANPQAPNPANPPGNSGSGGNPLDALRALGSSNFWIRVGEFIVGAILLTVGAAAILKKATGIDAGKKVFS